MTFDEKTLELSEHEGIKDHHLLLTEFQASVSEAANVIEHEIKGIFACFLLFIDPAINKVLFKINKY